MIDGGVQTALMDGVDGMVEQLTRWYLRNPSGLDMASEIERDRPGSVRSSEGLRSSGPEVWRGLHDERLRELAEARVPERAARFGAGVPGAGVCSRHPDGRPQLGPVDR